LLKNILSLIKEWYKRDKKIIFISAFIGFAAAGAAASAAYGYSQSVQSGIAKQLIRFHVLANSDSAEDQALKLLVRDGILDTLKEPLGDCETISDTREAIIRNISNIKTRAEEIIKENGYSYPVSVTLARDVFPVKTYGDITLPPGEYEALRVVIGAGAGKNWWCVMFPPLCFVDVTQPKLPDSVKSELKNVLTEDEYGIVTKSGDPGSPYKAKFKVVEIFQDIKNFFTKK